MPRLILKLMKSMTTCFRKSSRVLNEYCILEFAKLGYQYEFIIKFFNDEPNKLHNRLMMYNWQQKDWPQFQYDLDKMEDRPYAFAEKLGRISGVLKALPKEDHVQAQINILVDEAIKTSEIEGEYLSCKDVASSIRHNLGINIDQKTVKP